MDDLIGAQVGSIRVVSRLGGGGMGEVYRGFDTRLERPVALKTIRHDRRLSAEFKARFRREARLLSKLGDPGICQIYELIETPDADFLVWLLQSALGRLRVAEILAVQKQCAKARESIAAMDAILPASTESGFSKTHLARRQLLLARCALQDGASEQALLAFKGAREVFGAPETVTGTSSLAHLALALLGLGDEAALAPVLERLRARGYRGRLVREACAAAGRGDCLR